MAFNFSGWSVATVFIPSNKLPLPNAIKPSIGTKTPTIKSPIPFKVSEIAIAFKPPKIAYNIPIIPITQTITHIDCSYVI